jgi:anti-sigma B factor antagonist
MREPASLQIDRQDHPEGVVLTVSGELAFDSAPRLHQAVTGLPGPVVVLDLGAVSFLDSTALGVLLRLERETKARSGRLCFANPSPVVLRLFVQSGLLRSFKVFDTAEEALRECAGSAPSDEPGSSP